MGEGGKAGWLGGGERVRLGCYGTDVTSSNTNQTLTINIAESQHQIHDMPYIGILDMPLYLKLQIVTCSVTCCYLLPL